MAWRLRFLRCDFRFGSQVGDERSGHQSDISVVEIIALPMAGFARGALGCQPGQQGATRSCLGGRVFFCWGKGGDGTAMGEDGEALPACHLPQQTEEPAVGLGRTHEN